jgi:hypothetical protein
MRGAIPPLPLRLYGVLLHYVQSQTYLDILCCTAPGASLQ